MSKFTLEKFEAVCGKQNFHLLKKDGVCEFIEFEAEVKGTQNYKDFKKIISLMAYVGNLGTLPHTKFKEITPDKELEKEYEFKSVVCGYIFSTITPKES